MRNHFMKAALCALLVAGSASLPSAGARDAGHSDWTAGFLTFPARSGAGEKPVPIVYFRRSFDLGVVPERAELTATGCRFKVFVNGRFAGEGVPHNVGNQTFTVSFDVAKWLRAGENVIAVEAQFVNPSRNSRAPPMFSAVLDAGDLRLVTDETWRMFASPAWGIVEGHSSGRDFVAVFDSGKDPAGWKEPGFGDARWTPATAVSVAQAKHVAIRPAAIPNFERRAISPSAVAAIGEVVQILGDTRVNVALQMATETLRPLTFGNIANPDNLLTPDAATLIEPQVYADDLLAYDTWWDRHVDMPVARDVSFIVDFGAIRNAYLAMDVAGNRGATIDVAWGQTLIDGRVLPIVYSRSDRDAVGRADHQFALRWMLRGGREKFESMNYKNFRYLQVTARNLSAPLIIHGISAIHSFVPMTPRGQFSCSDPFLTELFAASLRTLQASSYDTFFDNTIREKNIWGGDISDGSVPTALAGYGDDPMTRNYLDLFVRSQHPNGELTLIAGSEMPSKGMALMMHPMRTAIWMAQYVRWAGDPDLAVETFAPVLLAYRDYWRGRNRDGLVVLGAKTDGPMEQSWIDWSSNKWQTDFAPGGVLVPWNLLYVRFLEELAAMVPEPRAAELRAEAGTIIDWVFAHCWDDPRGLYVDGYSEGEPIRTFSEHANFLALACGLGRAGRARRIVEALAEMKPGADRVVRCQAPFLFWPYEGLFAVGEDIAALDLMRDRYRRFTLEDGALDCFWEEYSFLLGQSAWRSRYRSLAQNGAGSPAFHLLTKVLGVRPTRPGFARFVIQPQPGDLDWAEGVIPSPRGDIRVRWIKEDGRLALDMTLPEGTCADVLWPNGRTSAATAGAQRLKQPE